MIFEMPSGDDIPENIALHLKKWKDLTRPLFLVARKRGIENIMIYEQGRKIVLDVRQYAVRLHNDYGQTKNALRCMLVLEKYLSHVSTELLKVINDDIATLTIRYMAKAHEYPEKKDETEYEEIDIKFSCKNILKRLRDGEMVIMGTIKLKDNGVYLRRLGSFSPDIKFLTWNEALITYRENENFFITDKDSVYYAQASYVNDMNTHVLEFMLDEFFRRFNPINHKLSDLLEVFS